MHVVGKILVAHPARRAIGIEEPLGVESQPGFVAVPPGPVAAGLHVPPQGIKDETGMVVVMPDPGGGRRVGIEPRPLGGLLTNHVAHEAGRIRGIAQLIRESHILRQHRADEDGDVHDPHGHGQRHVGKTQGVRRGLKHREVSSQEPAGARHGFKIGGAPRHPVGVEECLADKGGDHRVGRLGRGKEPWVLPGVVIAPAGPAPRFGGTVFLQKGEHFFRGREMPAAGMRAVPVEKPKDEEGDSLGVDRLRHQQQRPGVHRAAHDRLDGQEPRPLAPTAHGAQNRAVQAIMLVVSTKALALAPGIHPV